MKCRNVNYFCKAQHQKCGQLIPWESTSTLVLQPPSPGSGDTRPFWLSLPTFLFLTLLLCGPVPLFQPPVMLKSFCDGSDD